MCACLALAVWIVFGQTRHHEFVNFDDDVYVSQNRVVQAGLTPGNIARAFTQPHESNWHPLATLSHMLDCQLFGLKAGKHHVTNVLIHLATAILLFLVLRQMTGALWASAFVAAVFAVHPLRVESVAWVAERKDVLSGLFFVLTLGAYTRYVRKPSAGRYLLVLLTFALGLLSKSMLVTVPFVLLLLDYWPLRRYATEGGNLLIIPRRLWLEKIPLLAMSAVLCYVTLHVQRDIIQRASELSLQQRIADAIVSYAVYMVQTFWPRHLAPFYPLSLEGHATSVIVLAFVLLAAVSVFVFRWRKKRPWIVTGWLWYLGMLVPVIGLVQVGAQAHADRYTYLPQIGFLLLATWGLAELTATWPNRRWVRGTSAGIALASLIITARVQTSHWHDSEALWTHTLASTTEENALAHSNLGNHLFHKGEIERAVRHCRKTLEIWPDDPGAHNCIGVAILEQGQVNQAIDHFQQALKSRPNYAPAHANLGLAYLQLGRENDAIPSLRKALERDSLMPDAHNSLGLALIRTSQVKEGIAEYERAIELKPEYPGAKNNLAWVLATWPEASFRNGPRAVELATHANQLTGGGNLVILRTLAASLAEAGRFAEAINIASQALQLANAQSNPAFARALTGEIQLYQSGQCLRDVPPAQ